MADTKTEDCATPRTNCRFILLTPAFAARSEIRLVGMWEVCILIVVE
jgi:hypothetical protein